MVWCSFNIHKRRVFSKQSVFQLFTSFRYGRTYTSNIKDYENLAVFLGNNSSKLKEIKKKLINNAKISNVFKAKVYTGNLEKAYKEVYERNQKNLKPENIYLN